MGKLPHKEFNEIALSAGFLHLARQKAMGYKSE
jgi:hypothetical protein